MIIKWGSNQKYCGKPCYLSHKSPTRAFREKIATGHRTDIEKIVEGYLVYRDVEYIWEKRVGRYFIDFFLPAFNVAIECDAAYWHDASADAVKDAYLSNRVPGLHILRLSDAQIKGGEAAFKISQLLGLLPACALAA